MNDISNVRVLLLDDHVIIRESCRKLLEQENMEIVWEGENGDDAFQHYISLQPDIAVVDLSVKGTKGIKLIRLLREYDSNGKVIVFSMHTDSIFVSNTLSLGVLGYISKTCNPVELITAIKAALNNHVYISKDLDYMDDNRSAKDEKVQDILASLTAQEKRIFTYILQGESTTNIGKVLKISPKSVSTHLSNIKSKLGANNIPDIVRISIALDIDIEHI